MISIKKVLEKLAKQVPELLWENPNPADDFASTTLSIDLSDYEYIEIISEHGRSASFKIRVGKQGLIYGFTNFGSASNEMAFHSRSIDTTDSSITIGNSYGKKMSATSAGTISNSYNRPYKIYGIR